MPGEPGWSLPIIYYHASSDADASRAFQIGGRTALGLEAKADLFLFAPSYVFANPVAGGQASVGLTGLFGRMKVDASATLTGPSARSFPAAAATRSTASATFIPPHRSSGTAATTTSLPTRWPACRWAVPGGAPANLGTNHWSLDLGGGYTYLDAKKGHELSAVLGFTFNGENDDTSYKNGTSAHLDWAASQFLSEQLHVGLVGYFYHQLTGDSGSGAVLGDFKSRVSAIGAQAGYFLRRWAEAVPELQGLSRVRREEPAGGVERVGYGGDSVGCEVGQPAIGSASGGRLAVAARGSTPGSGTTVVAWVPA